MRSSIISIFCGLVLRAAAFATDADYTSLPDWHRGVLDKASFDVRLLPPSAFFPAGDSPAGLSEDGFLLVSCSARQNLGKRLLWINADVEFSNGSTRTFKSLTFHLLEGAALSIEKLDFPVTPTLKIKSFKITSIAVK